MEYPAAFARRLGVHKSTVSRAIAAGRLVLVSGQLEIADSLRRWDDTKPGTRPDVLARHAAKRKLVDVVACPAAEIAPRAPESAAMEDSGEEFESDDAALTIAVYRKQTMQAENNLAKLATHLRTGRAIPLQKLISEAQSLGSNLRQALERLVDQTAPRLAATQDNANRNFLLSAEIRFLRRTMQKQFIRSLKNLRPEAAKP
jgi:predicted DNA-binding protein (UPF0251 family)